MVGSTVRPDAPPATRLTIRDPAMLRAAAFAARVTTTDAIGRSEVTSRRPELLAVARGGGCGLAVVPATARPARIRTRVRATARRAAGRLTRRARSRVSPSEPGELVVIQPLFDELFLDGPAVRIEAGELEV